MMALVSSSETTVALSTVWSGRDCRGDRAVRVVLAEKLLDHGANRDCPVVIASQWQVRGGISNVDVKRSLARQCIRIGRTREEAFNLLPINAGLRHVDFIEDFVK